MTLRARTILGEAIRDLRGSFRALVLTDLWYKLISFAVLSPLTLLMLRWAMARAGADVVTDAEIATFFLTSRPGVIALVLGSAVVTAITALELACVMAIGLAAAQGRPLRVRAALAFGASRGWPVLRLAVNIVVRVIAALVPVAAVVGAAYWLLLRDHDINYYLSRRPPEFLAAVAIAGVAVLGLVAWLVRAVGHWALALPLVLFEGVSPRRALAESTARMTGRLSVVLPALLAWAAVAALFIIAAASLPELAGRAFAPRIGSSLEVLLTFVTGLVMFWALLGLVAAVFNAVLFALVLVRLYVRFGAPPASWMAGLGTLRDGDVPRLPTSVRVMVAAAIVVTAIGVTLLATGTARRNQPVVVIAHRGASAAAPENTLAAFRLAGEQRTDFVELDVQESADGEVVVIHDADLMKVGGSPLKVWESTAADLRTVDIGSHKDRQFAAERVPTLAEALAACKGRSGVIVELKTYGHGKQLEEKVVAIVEASGMARDTVFMSLDHGMARKMKSLRPDWRVGVLVAKAMGDLTSIETDFLAVQAGMATRRFIRQAHRAGLEVYAWTVNDPALLVSLMSQGVDGLITDKPDLARRVIERRSQLSDEQRVAVALLVRLGVSAEALARAATQ